MRIDLIMDPIVTAEDALPAIQALNYIRNIINPLMDEDIQVNNLGYYRAEDYQNGAVLVPHKSINWFLEIAYKERVKSDNVPTETLNSKTLLSEGMTYCLKNQIYAVVFVLDREIFHPTDGWMIGATTKYWCSVINIGRFKSFPFAERQDLIKTLAMHELGHLFGLIEDGRPGSVQFLGNHCTNTSCVMQQGPRIPQDWIRIKNASKKKWGRLNFCLTCQRELVRHANELNELAEFSVVESLP